MKLFVTFLMTLGLATALWAGCCEEGKACCKDKVCCRR